MKNEDKTPVTYVAVNPMIIDELKYMIELHQQHGPSDYFQNVEQLVGFILSSIADGSRRPGSWERGMLYPMNLVANCPEHDCYREDYGKPKE